VKTGAIARLCSCKPGHHGAARRHAARFQVSSVRQHHDGSGELESDKVDDRLLHVLPPDHLLTPLSRNRAGLLQLLSSPVVLTLQVVLVETGVTFQRRAIEDWFAR
jgi:hypothetical protein